MAGIFVSVFFILFGVFGLIFMIMKINRDAKIDLLKELKKDGVIDNDTYVKYFSKIIE
jgi:hypothetical protein